MLVFKNAVTGKVAGPAKPAPGMTQAEFDAITEACDDGRAFDAATGLCAIMDSQPHHGCFLVLSDEKEPK